MILITGATGNVGQPLISALHRTGATIRAVSRNPAKAVMSTPVECVEGDPSRPGTLASAMRGVTSLFLNPLAVQGAVRELLTLARDNGVQRVVALSATNVDDDPADQPSRLRGVNHKEVEDALVQCGVEWVVLRMSTYALNSISLWSTQIRAGTWSAARTQPPRYRPFMNETWPR
jgi:uncharacterized protein YbjT (DUF2867 family)